MLATASGSFDVQVIAQTFLGMACYAVGDYWQGVHCMRQVIALLPGELSSACFGLPVLPAALARSHAACGLAEWGDFVQGAKMGQDALQLAEVVAQPPSIANALWCAGMVPLRQGDVHAAIPILEQALALSQTANILLLPLSTSLLGAAYALAGRTAEALPILGQMLECVAVGNPMFFPALGFTELREALLLVGRVDEASMLAGRLLELSRTHTGSGYQAHAYRLLSEVARHREPPDVDQAAAHYHQALDLAEKLGMRPLQAHCHLGLGILYHQMGCVEQARLALSTALDCYRAMNMTFWLPQAEAALAQVEGR